MNQWMDRRKKERKKQMNKQIVYVWLDGIDRWMDEWKKGRAGGRKE